MRKNFGSGHDHPQHFVHFFYIVWFFLEFRNLLQYNTLPTIIYEPELEELKDLYYSFDLVRAIMDYEGLLLVFEKISFFRSSKVRDYIEKYISFFRKLNTVNLLTNF